LTREDLNVFKFFVSSLLTCCWFLSKQDFGRKRTHDSVLGSPYLVVRMNLITLVMVTSLFTMECLSLSIPYVERKSWIRESHRN